MKDEHILLSTDGPDCNVIKLKPPMVFSKDNVDEVIANLDKILKEVRSMSEYSVPVTSPPIRTKVLPDSFSNKEPRTIKNSEKEHPIKSI